MKTNHLEFHYLIGCMNGYWQVVVEDGIMPDGTIYDWENNEWTFPPDSREDDSVETLDLHNYRMLQSALRLLNEGAINA